MRPPPLSDNSYADQLGAVLRKHVAEELRQFLAARAHDFGDETQAADLRAMGEAELEALMHRMTLARPDLASFHNDSRTWLAGHGMSGSEPTPGRARPQRRRSSPRPPRRRT